MAENHHTDSPAILQDDGSYTFAPAFTADTVHSIERSHANWQPIRRAAMAVLARSYDDLAEPLVDDDEKADALIFLVEQIDEFLQWRERESELLHNALARLQLVLMQEAERLEAGMTRH